MVGSPQSRDMHRILEPSILFYYIASFDTYVRSIQYVLGCAIAGFKSVWWCLQAIHTLFLSLFSAIAGEIDVVAVGPGSPPSLVKSFKSFTLLPSWHFI